MEAEAENNEVKREENSNDNNNNESNSKFGNSSEGQSKPKRQMKTPFQLETLEKAYAEKNGFYFGQWKRTAFDECRILISDSEAQKHWKSKKKPKTMMCGRHRNQNGPHKNTNLKHRFDHSTRKIPNHQN
ncbi:hypothetical protein DEO72_LG1g416 [Vigna unguiculata]|uniref:Uncharacterized protein n=1 Tax=Vigna unguiculata TaxID=3917 RepID=A0A4D6KJC9_VIGUN|nr:hypothetical protein DEO72_LG1g416 [Vigna unguiculata]